MVQKGILLKGLYFVRVTVSSLAKVNVYLLCDSFMDENIEYLC